MIGIELVCSVAERIHQRKCHRSCLLNRWRMKWGRVCMSYQIGRSRLGSSGSIGSSS